MHGHRRARRAKNISKIVAFWGAFSLPFKMLASKTSPADMTFLYAFSQNDYFILVIDLNFELDFSKKMPTYYSDALFVAKI